MRVTILSDSAGQGGAAFVANRLCDALRARDVHTTRIAVQARRLSRGVVCCPTPRWRWLLGGIISRLHHKSTGRRLREPGVVARLRHAVDSADADVVNVHNLHGAIDDPRRIREIAGGRPVVWTLHDMWSFTARCPHAGNCTRFIDGCTPECPTADEYPREKPHRIPGAWRRRRELFSDSLPLVGVTPSRWLAAAANQGLWRTRTVHVIPNGVDLERYRPQPRAQARAALGLSQQGVILAIGAANLADPMKGIALFAQAVRALPAPAPRVLTFGRKGRRSLRLPGAVTHLGSVHDSETLALVYSAADAFVLPSLRENLPLVLIEALACGTPCVGLPVGGVPEIVRDGETGWLAEAPNAEALQAALTRAVTDIEQGTDLRERCRQVAVREYGIHLQAERYLKLFEGLRAEGWAAARGQ